ncbi:multidrug transporter [Paenibacillus baekrokdamisoli]|uniref:Multidrug transporter n=1 Tax=Paenibacillus baekrokdamisoli TaxID=1712516 RepID=A0A3G9IPA9_9BACL|nr:DMT family transporter [Paenibacillus baekrokdamisoli]MBB3069947.1 drug/metabolite transporter (DMT)-like permease [Paenibacillus baekrokdamisoli]BBH20700.1 multidrug transporter [Paenibacillus baekrokdamisoli]
MKSSSQSISPILPLLVGMIAISFAPILVRYSDAPVSVQGMYRMLFTVIIMLPFGTKQFKSIGAISRKDWLLLGAAGFFLAVHFLLWMASLNYTSIASSTIILSLEPVFVMVGAYFIFKDKPNKLMLIGMVVALIGAFFVGSGDIGITRSAFNGDVLSFLGALAVAVNMLIAKRIITRVPSYLYSIIVFAITFLCFLVYNLAMGISMLQYPVKEWFVFLLLAIVPTVFGHMIFNWLLQYVKATTISMSVLAEPIGSSLLGMLLFHEMVTGFQLIGGAFVIIGLLLYLRSEQSGPAPEPFSQSMP